LLGVSSSFQRCLAHLNRCNIEVIVKKLMYHLWYIRGEGVKVFVSIIINKMIISFFFFNMVILLFLFNLRLCFKTENFGTQFGELDKDSHKKH